MPQGQEFFTRRPDAQPTTLDAIINRVARERVVDQTQLARLNAFLPGGKDSLDALVNSNRTAFQNVFPDLLGSQYEGRFLKGDEVRPVTYRTMRRAERVEIGIAKNWLIDKLAIAGQSRRRNENEEFTVVPGADSHLYQFAGERRWYVDRSLAANIDSNHTQQKLETIATLTEALTVANLSLLSEEVDITDSGEARRVLGRDFRGLLSGTEIDEKDKLSIYMSFIAKRRKRITQRGGLTIVYMDEARAEKHHSDFTTGIGLDNLTKIYLATKVIAETADMYRKKGLTTSRINEGFRDKIRQDMDSRYHIGPGSRALSSDEELFFAYIGGNLPQLVRDLEPKQ